MAIVSGFDRNFSYDRPAQKPNVVPKQMSGSNETTIVKEPDPSTQEPEIKEQKETKEVQETKESEIHEASSVSNNDTMQDNVLNDHSTKTIISENKKPPSVRKKITKSTIQIRDFPRDVMDIIRGIVPGGNSYVETLLAYIYVTSPTKFDIPSNVQDIVDRYEHDDPSARILKEIRLLREQVRDVEIASYQGTLASEYNLMTSLGFRNDKATNPSDINYLEPGVEDMHIALENKAKQLKKKDNVRRGRKG